MKLKRSISSGFRSGKLFLLFLLSGLLLSACSSFNTADITAYQHNLWEEFNNPETTPVMEDERADFHGITFFPISKDFIVNAKFAPIPNAKTLPFPTSAGKIKHYKEYGLLKFMLENEEFELTIYQSDPPIEGYETSLFLPFTDDTNGDTSYGGGRYMDFEISDIKNNSLLIDFNKAYNPYCAYSKYYNCPIPPRNNYLATEIRAGVSYEE